MVLLEIYKEKSEVTNNYPLSGKMSQFPAKVNSGITQDRKKVINLFLIPEPVYNFK